MVSVMVSVPTFGGSVKSACAEAIGNAVDRAVGDHDISRVVHHNVTGYDVARARNMMARAALEEEVDYLWTVDSDVIVPEHALSTLLSHGADVVTGWYVRGSSDTGMTPVVPEGSTSFMDSMTAAEVAEFAAAGVHALPAKGNGMGCALFRTSAFGQVPRPWFRFVDHDDGTALGEDYWFCHQLASAGKMLLVDPSVGCGHIHDRILEAR